LKIGGADALDPQKLYAVGICAEIVAGREASVGSKKRSAWQKQKAEFAASLGGMDDLFASESARSQRHEEERAAARRHKACERKNRYASRYEAELTAAECAEHGAPPLHVYRCPYCNGWHLTSKGE
ncbi:MAG: hypothetical protein ACLUJY_05295, partial [Adlercreutzia equolifaciens subsp. celatus]|uniref:hypothetical protein n=1 Tax=Adlercreutzia equolifaciens TaxID=446660 RepID=UPI0039966962